jgi:hypothetical protein
MTHGEFACWLVGALLAGANVGFAIGWAIRHRLRSEP